MKILMLTHEFPPFRGGIATYASQLAIAAHNLGHEMTVVAPDFGQELVESDKHNYPLQVIRYHAGEYSYKKLPALLWRTRRWSRRNGYDIIHAVDWPHILGLAFLNRFRTIPFVATVYGTDLLSGAGCRQVRYLGVDSLFSKPKQIFSISEFTKSLYFQKCPTIVPDRVLLTPLGVDKKWFCSVEHPRYVLEKYSIPRDHNLILTVARLDERKGHRTVLKALALLSQSMKKSVTYVIVGTGNDQGYIGKLKKLASQSGTNVLFTGEIGEDDLHALYASASLFCMPGEPHAKKVEGFGLVYLEAAAQGLPSIASRLGAVPEVVIDHETGILVEPLDVNGVAEAIEQLLNAEKLRKSLGRAARAHAELFTWQRCAEITYGK